MKLTTNLKDQIADDFAFALSTAGEQVTVNSQPQQVLISAKKPNESYDGLTVSSLSKLATGDIITYQDKQYLAISEVASNRRGISKALLRHLPYNIAINCSCDFVTVPCFFDSRSYDITGKYVPIAEGTILATIPALPATSKIKLDDRFIKLGGAWKIAGIDKTKPGLITLTCDKDIINPSLDDTENQLAGVFGCQITITTEPVELQPDDTLQITWTGVQSVTFTSSNEEVATVDQNGLVTAIGAGTFTITVASSYASDSITLTVAEPLPTTVTIEGFDTIRVGMTSTYTADAEVSWKLTNEDGTATTFASIESSTTTSCVVEAGQTMNKKVKLTATLLANEQVTGEIIITTKPLF